MHSGAWNISRKPLSQQFAHYTLEEKKDVIDTLISEQLQPKLAAFEEELEQQLKLIRLSSELEVIRQNETQYRSELFSKKTEETPEDSKHNIFEDYDYDIIQGFENKLREILQASKIGGAATARLNMENFDIEIGSLKKSVSMGGGFCLSMALSLWRFRVWRLTEKRSALPVSGNCWRKGNWRH